MLLTGNILSTILNLDIEVLITMESRLALNNTANEELLEALEPAEIGVISVSGSS